jgi:hypothetical protein
MDIASYILNHTTAAIIVAGVLIVVAGFILRKFKILYYIKHRHCHNSHKIMKKVLLSSDVAV